MGWVPSTLPIVIIFCLQLVAFAFVLVTYERYLLILDETGIRQRTMFRWQSWTWEEIESEMVEWDWKINTISRPKAAKGDRQLYLNLLAESEQKSLRVRLYKLVRKQKPPVPQDEYLLKRGEYQLKFLQQEFRLKSPFSTQEKVIPWNEISATLWRKRHDQPGCDKIELRAAVLRQPERLSGHQAIGLAEFILQRVPGERTSVVATDEAPITQKELAFRCDELGKKRKLEIGITWVRVFIFQSYWIMLVSHKPCFWQWNEWDWLNFGIIFSGLQLMVAASYWSYLTEKNQHQEKLQELI